MAPSTEHPSPRQMIGRAAWSPLALAGGVSMAISVLMLSVPMFSLQVYDRVLGSGSRETLLALLLITGAGAGGTGLAGDHPRQRLARLSTRLGARLSTPLLAAGARSGDPGQGLRDLTQLRQMLAGPALTAMFDAPWLPLALALIWLLHPEARLVRPRQRRCADRAGDHGRRRRPDGACGKPIGWRPVIQRQVDALGRQREVVTAMGLLPNLQARFARLHDQVLVLQQRAYERGGLVAGLARSSRLMIQAGVMALGAFSSCAAS